MEQIFVIFFIILFTATADLEFHLTYYCNLDIPSLVTDPVRSHSRYIPWVLLS